MRLVIFGASGRTGRQLVEQALARGHTVTAFVRNPATLAIAHRDLRLARGDVGDRSAVESVVQGQDAALSALGVGKPLRHDPVVVAGIRHLVEAMEKAGVRRLIYLSTLGVRESRSSAGFVIRTIGRVLLRQEFADHETKEALVKASTLDWTIVRAPGLTMGPRTGRYRSGVHLVSDRAFPALSRSDVAEFMLNQLTDTSHARQAVRLFP